jgi:hypothetical protein
MVGIIRRQGQRALSTYIHARGAGMAIAKGKVVVKFERERETKNKIRFSEIADADKEVIGKLYVGKTTDEKLGNPDNLTITLTV